MAGVSGAGRSSVLATLSDLGLYALDNLPVELLKDFLTLSRNDPERFRNTCIHLEFGAEDGIDQLLSVLGSPTQDKTPKFPPNVTLVFLDASDETIVKRYSETRRPHPAFNIHNHTSILDAIEHERKKLIRFKEVAHVVIDTSDLTIHQLRRRVKVLFDGSGGVTRGIVSVNLLSFGFKYGLPIESDLVADVRFLPNPHFVAGLRAKTGIDPEVIDFVSNQPDTKSFLERYSELLNFLVPRYIAEGKSYITIGIGCTGGRHRSPVIAEALRASLKLDGCVINTRHRDIERK